MKKKVTTNLSRLATRAKSGAYRGAGKVAGSGADYILPVGILALVGWGAYKLFGVFNSAGSSNNASIDQTTQEANQTTLNQQTASGQGPTISDAQAAGIAQQIFNIGIAGDSDQYYQINSLMTEANNLADVLLIKKYFGTKQVNATNWYSICALLGINCNSVDLDSFIKLLLTGENAYLIDSMNQYFQDMGINYRF